MHSRSESGKWGLNEIVWALDLNLDIVDFHFQRCRGKGCGAVESEPFKEQLLGKGYDDLITMVSDDGAKRAVAFWISSLDGVYQINCRSHLPSSDSID